MSGTGRVPDLFLAGHPKCGTTALYQMLGQHPRIFAPTMKEPDFLNSASRKPTRPESLAAYLELFSNARPDQLAVDGSVSYLRSTDAASQIARLNPSARIIGVFREPASFVRSFHLQLLRGPERRESDLRRAVGLAAEQPAASSLPPDLDPPTPPWFEYLSYTEQVRRYHAVLPADQLMIVIYDDLAEDNISTLRRIFQFLGIDHRMPIQPVRANRSVAVRSRRVQGVVGRLALGRDPATRLVKGLTPRRLRRAIRRQVDGRVVYAAPPPVDEELMSEIRHNFRPEVERFGEYIGRDLVGLWGYRDA